MSANGTRLYLDHNATTPLRPAARAAMLDALAETGNASSVHGEGRTAHKRLEDARRAVAGLTGAAAKNVVFTSGGTEANNTALCPQVIVAGRPRPASRLFVSAVEHASVLAGGRFEGGHVSILPVDGQGVVDLDQCSDLVMAEARAGGVPFVSVMAANNETGVVQPISEISAIVRAAEGYLHVDAVQSLGRMTVSMDAWDADAVTVSSHKVGGPQGAGALILGNDIHVAPLLGGGGQETRRRSGTENVAAISGFGAAIAEVSADLQTIHRLRELRDWLEAELTHIRGDTVIFGGEVQRLPNTLCFAVPGMVAETALIACDLAGAAVSSGSACSSGKVASSHVLKAMGVPADVARGAIRVSLGWTNTKDDVERFAGIWRGLVNRMCPAPAGRTHMSGIRRTGGMKSAVS